MNRSCEKLLFLHLNSWRFATLRSLGRFVDSHANAEGAWCHGRCHVTWAHPEDPHVLPTPGILRWGGHAYGPGNAVFDHGTCEVTGEQHPSTTNTLLTTADLLKMPKALVAFQGQHSHQNLRDIAGGCSKAFTGTSLCIPWWHLQLGSSSLEHFGSL